MTTTARFWTKLALALALVLAGAAALVFHAHQHASSLDEVWPDKPTASRGAAPPLAAQHAALAPAGALGITIELPVGDHWGERDRAAKLFAGPSLRRSIAPLGPAGGPTNWAASYPKSCGPASRHSTRAPAKTSTSSIAGCWTPGTG